MNKTISIALIMLFLVSSATGSIGLNGFTKTDDKNANNPIVFSPLFTFFNDFPARYEEFFSVSEVVDFDIHNHGLTTSDFNNDGLLDFAASTDRSENITIFYNRGNNEFDQETAVYLNDLNIPWPVQVQEGICDLESADFDGDGDIDIIFTTNENNFCYNVTCNWNGTGILLFNDGTNHFSEWRQVFFHSGGDGQTWSPYKPINPVISSGDYDQDGDCDFLVGDNSGKVSFYANDGTGNFSFVIDSTFGMKMSRGLDSADFDGDGDLDFICTQNSASSWDGKIIIKWNHGGSTCFDHDDYQSIISLPCNYSFATSMSPPANFGCLQCIDYNNDSRMDVLFGERGFILMFIQKEDYYFESYDVCSFSLTNDDFAAWIGDNSLLQGDIVVGDFDNDGLDDAMVGGDEGVIRCFHNQYMLADIERIDRATVMFVSDEVRYVNLLLLSYPIAKYGTTIVIGDITIPVKNISPLQKVEFFLDDVRVFTDDKAPFIWNWTTPGFGRHIVKAVPYDIEGNIAGYDEEVVWKFL